MDYAYGREITSVVNISLPDSFEVKEPVGNKSFSIGSDEAVFTRHVSADSARIQMICKFALQKSVFEPEQYDNLKNFYAQAVNAQSEQFVIGRRKLPSPPPAVQSDSVRTVHKPGKGKKKGGQ